MRPPILFLTIAFGAGLFLGETGNGKGETYVAVPVVLAALVVARRAPVGAATGVMAVAGLVWGGAAVGGRGAKRAGRRGRGARSGGRGAWKPAARVRLLDPGSGSGGRV